jgi:hypothetical protein
MNDGVMNYTMNDFAFQPGLVLLETLQVRIPGKERLFGKGHGENISRSGGYRVTFRFVGF